MILDMTCRHNGHPYSFTMVCVDHPSADYWGYWVPGLPAEWGTDRGTITSWTDEGVFLSGPGGDVSVSLWKLPRAAVQWSKGSGAKNYPSGLCPEGQFEWEICGVR